MDNPLTGTHQHSTQAQSFDQQGAQLQWHVSNTAFPGMSLCSYIFSHAPLKSVLGHLERRRCSCAPSWLSSYQIDDASTSPESPQKHLSIGVQIYSS
jgi:hypothetical protein